MTRRKDRRCYGKNPYCHIHLYSGGIREPLIVCWPAVVKPSTTSDVPVASVDCLPTICEAAAEKMPEKTAQLDNQFTQWLMQTRAKLPRPNPDYAPK